MIYLEMLLVIDNLLYLSASFLTNDADFLQQLKQKIQYNMPNFPMWHEYTQYGKVTKISNSIWKSL